MRAPNRVKKPHSNIGATRFLGNVQSAIQRHGHHDMSELTEALSISQKALALTENLTPTERLRVAQKTHTLVQRAIERLADYQFAVGVRDSWASKAYQKLLAVNLVLWEE